MSDMSGITFLGMTVVGAIVGGIYAFLATMVLGVFWLLDAPWALGAIPVVAFTLLLLGLIVGMVVGLITEITG